MSSVMHFRSAKDDIQKALKSKLNRQTTSENVKTVKRKENLAVTITRKALSSSVRKPPPRIRENHTTLPIRKRKRPGKANKKTKMNVMSLAQKRHQERTGRQEGWQKNQKGSKGNRPERHLAVAGMKTKRVSREKAYKRLVLEYTQSRIRQEKRTSRIHVEKGRSDPFQLLVDEKGGPPQSKSKHSYSKATADGISSRLKKNLVWIDDYVNRKTVRKVEYIPKGWHFDINPRKIGYYSQPTFVFSYKQTGHMAKVDKKISQKKFEKYYLPPKNTKERIKKIGRAIAAESGKNALGAVAGTSKAGFKATLDGTKRNYQSSLQQEGNFGGEIANEILNAPEYARTAAKAGHLTLEGSKASFRLVWNTVKNTGITAYNVGSLALDGTGALYHNRHRLPQYLKKSARNSVRKGIQKARALKQSVPKTLKKMARKAAELAKAIFMKLIGMLGGAAILFLILFLIPIIIVLIVVISIAPVLAPLEDGNSILATNQFCIELVEEWNDKMEELKEKYEVYNECPYGNNDKCNVHIQCDEEEARVLPSTLELYALAVVNFEYDIQNMGIPFGNKHEEGTEREEIEAFIEECFYYLNPIEEKDMKIEQEIFECYRTEEGEDGEIELHQHDYTITDIYVNLRTTTELLAHLGWDGDKIEEYNDFLNELMLESFNTESGGDNQWKEVVKEGSDYDYMPDDVFVEFWDDDVPVLNITRSEFTKMVTSYCIPKGQIKYKYGSKNPASGALDCSGFTAYMFDKIGIDIRQGTSAQWSNSVGITAAVARPGDLVFKQSPNSNGINHVGIYLGEGVAEGKFAHCASSSGSVVNSYSGFVYYRRPLVKFKDDIPQKNS